MIGTPAPLELDFLVNTLRNPPKGASVQTILGYLYNYLPYVKHEHNLRVVFSSFLNNPVCFGPTVPAFHDNYLIVEVFKLITDKKLRVSQPTLPVKTFYSVMAREMQNFVGFDPAANSWKVLPVICGISLSNALRDGLLTNFFEYRWFFSDFDAEMHHLFTASFQKSFSSSSPGSIVDLALLCLALKVRPLESLGDYLGPVSPALVIKKLIALVFEHPGGANAYRQFEAIRADDPDLDATVNTKVYQDPVAKHLNKFASMLEQLFQSLPHAEASHSVIQHTLTVMKQYNIQLNHFTQAHPVLNVSTDSLGENNAYEQQFWLFLKRVFFSEVLIFQGIISRFLSLKKVGLFRQLLTPKLHISRLELEYCDISHLILHNLYFVNFVLMAIGQGGFDGYNFVYYVCLEILLKNNVNDSFETFSRSLVENIDLRPDAFGENYVSRSKVLFAFGLWENYFQQAPKKNGAFVQFIFNFTFDFVRDPFVEDNQLIEAGHSVLLIFFSNKKDTQENLQQVLQYFELLVSQFPARLSAHQLSVAVETLGKKIMASPVQTQGGMYANSVEEFLEFVYFKCASTTPGQPIEKRTSVTFTSAQPVSEIDASSTLNQLKKHSDNTDIVKQNKHKKPKDLAFIDVVSLGKKDPHGQFAARVTPDTSREGILVAFMNVVPYLPMSIFARWLEKIWGLIAASSQSEQEFLVGKLWKVISENLDLNRCEIAYDWWYEEKRAAQTDGQVQGWAKL